MKTPIMVISILLTLALSACNTPPAPVTETPDINSSTAQITQNCETACENYKTQCLQLVPGATQQLYKDGIESCMNECKDWSAEKADCITTALNCTSMTEICEL